MRIVCFGEIMGRLNPEGYRRLSQADRLELSYGGSEANVAASVCILGAEGVFVSALPRENPLAAAAMGGLRAHGVDVSGVLHRNGRMGLYFIEKGASQRPSRVVYDRAGSSISLCRPGDFDWAKILEGADVFHLSGITPALSDGCAALCREACAAAKAAGVTVSLDINYRASLWDTDKAGRVLCELMEFVDIAVTSEDQCALLFGIRSPLAADTRARQADEVYTDIARQLSEKFSTPTVALTIRETITAETNRFGAMLYKSGSSFFSRQHTISLVDRIGGGDAFTAALLHSLLSGSDAQRSIEFATAAGVLAQTIDFDINLSTHTEIYELARDTSDGRVKR